MHIKVHTALEEAHAMCIDHRMLTHPLAAAKAGSIQQGQVKDHLPSYWVRRAIQYIAKPNQ
jgi:hypothetical protein